MSVDLGVRITSAEPLAAVLMHAEQYVTTVPHQPFVVEAGNAAEIVVSPSSAREEPGVHDELRRY